MWVNHQGCSCLSPSCVLHYFSTQIITVRKLEELTENRKNLAQYLFNHNELLPLCSKPVRIGFCDVVDDVTSGEGVTPDASSFQSNQNVGEVR